MNLYEWYTDVGITGGDMVCMVGSGMSLFAYYLAYRIKKMGYDVVMDTNKNKVGKYTYFCPICEMNKRLS